MLVIFVPQISFIMCGPNKYIIDFKTSKEVFCFQQSWKIYICNTNLGYS